MTLSYFPRTALFSLFITLAVSSASAQNILVTTGEHAGFTRLVLQSALPIDWELHDREADGTTRTLSIAGPDTPIDISRAFQRIPRARLGDLIRTQQGLELHLNCDCPIDAWTERPGLVVLDIGNPPRSGPAAPAPFLPSAAITRPPQFTGNNLARNAGITLARTWPADTGHPGITARVTAQGPMPSPLAETERQAIMQQLSAQVAGALSQGVLNPSLDPAPRTEMIRLGDTETDTAIPPNLRVMSVLDRPDDDATRLADDLPGACTAAATLNFVVDPAPGSFNTALATGMADWIGEFDQPEQKATEALILLYLQHGFGAEARALLENAVHPIPGRDLLLGFADTLEGRQSNSRLRLADQHGCGGAAAMLAALAGAPLPRVNARARDIASTYAQTPRVVRTGLGGALIRILLDADAIDAGRVVADTLRRTPHARSEDLYLADALLDRARGEALQAGARLTQEAGDDIEPVLLRLQIALETSAVVPESVLLNAEAIASIHRSTAQGTDLMDAIIRLRVNSGTPLEALTLIDRLQSWEGASTQAHERITELGDIVWFGLALQASEPAFLNGILNRTDWRNPAFSVETRSALAERLLGFGLTEVAETLLAAPRTEAERQLLARLHLEREEPDMALAALADDQSNAAETLRAQALHARGESRASSQIFSGIGAFDAAARAAVLGRDWDMLEEAWATNGTAAQRELARALSGLPTDTGGATNSPVDAGSQNPPASADPATYTEPREDRSSETRSQEARPVRPAALESPIAPPTATLTAVTEDDALRVPSVQPPRSTPTLAEWAVVADPAPAPNAMDRSARLLTESEALREAFAPLLNDVGTAQN